MISFNHGLKYISQWKLLYIYIYNSENGAKWKGQKRWWIIEFLNGKRFDRT